MKINLNNEEFGNLVISFLYDKMIRFDELVYKDKFNDIIKVMERKGMRPYFMQYYLKMDAEERLKYKRIKNSLEKGSDKQNQIVLTGDEREYKDFYKKVTDKVFGEGEENE